MPIPLDHRHAEIIEGYLEDAMPAAPTIPDEPSNRMSVPDLALLRQLLIRYSEELDERFPSSEYSQCTTGIIEQIGHDIRRDNR